MALQLTGAFKEDSLANLQVRAAGGRHRRRSDRDRHRDRAPRLLPVQVEKTLERYETLDRGEAARRRSAAIFDDEEREFLDRAPRARPSGPRASASARARAGESPTSRGSCREWGGVSLVYRGSWRSRPRTA